MSLTHLRFRESGTQASYSYEELVYNYGKSLADNLISSGYYNAYFYMPNDEYLIKHGYNSKYLERVKSNLKHGRPLEHISKKDGTIKKAYKKLSKAQVIKKYTGLDENARNVECYSFIYQRLRYLNTKRVMDKFKNLDIDIKIDPITQNDIKTPAYIKSDWDNGCKVVMDITTIYQCAEKFTIPMYYYTTHDGSEMMMYRHEYTGKYVSPYTRKVFTPEDIVKLPSCVKLIK